MVNSCIKEIIVVNYNYLKDVIRSGFQKLKGVFMHLSEQFTKEENQLNNKMGSLAAMLEIVFEPSNSFQVEPKTVKVNNKYLLSLTAYKDMSDTVYCQAGFKLQVIRNYGKVPLYTVALNKVQAASHTEP